MKLPNFYNQARYNLRCYLYGFVYHEHPLVETIVADADKKLKKELEAFLDKVKKEDIERRRSGDYEKEGIFTGKYVINPLSKTKVPLYLANFVLMEYGTGAIMAVPAHDQRDFEFAKKYNIPIKVVIQPKDKNLVLHKWMPFVDDGIMAHSDQFDKMQNLEAMR